MLKSIKSKLTTPATAGAATNQEAAERKRRQREKEREALASALSTQDNLPMRLASKSSAGKSLGSKKLATVVNRIKLITRAGRNKRWSPLKFDAQKHEHEDRKFQLVLSAARKQSALVRGEAHEPEEAEEDAQSFFSALDYFADEGHDCAHDSIESYAADRHSGGRATSESDADLRGYLRDSKYILPEEQCDIPTFLETKNCERALLDETRRLLRERHATNPDSLYDHDYQRMLTDDWTVTRFLLRRRLDPKRTAKLMEECGKFRKQYLMSEMQLWEFPREFHQAGGLFRYLPDRAGNQTLYMRVKMYRRVPEISDVFKAFILCVLEECDVANGGRGTAVIFDLSQAGLQNVDLAFLYWLLNSFRNYCPKGVSYILVYNLPWFLSATCKLAMTWLSETNRRALRFVSGSEIENFIARENLPDYLGGTCTQNYRKVPAGSRPATEVCQRLDITPAQALKIKELFKEYLNEGQQEEEEEEEEEEKVVMEYGQVDLEESHQGEPLDGSREDQVERQSVYGDLYESSSDARRSAHSSSASTVLMGDNLNLPTL